MRKYVILFSLLGVAVIARAQDITYIPDPSKKAQIQVMELGLNTLQPQYYYQLLHNSYYKNANSVTSVKESLRLQAGVGSNPQVDMADSIKEDLESRAKVEALNVTDRLTDVAWLTEGSKIEKKIATYRQNLLYLTGKAGQMEIDNWRLMADCYEFSVKAIREAYLPNSERQRMYLNIYNEVSKGNDLLISRINYLTVMKKADALLSNISNFHHRVHETAPAAFNRWRDASVKAVFNDSIDGSTAHP